MQRSQLDSYSLLNRQLESLLKIATPETHSSFFSQFGITNDIRLQFVSETNRSFERAISARDVTSPRIPKIIHRLWLTDTINPAMPQEAYLNKILHQAKIFKEDYTYIFWHNCDHLATEISRIVSGANIEMRNIATISNSSTLLSRIESAIAVRKYVMAADITKYLLLREYGGIYADLGIDFEEPLIDLIRHSDIALFLDDNLFFQPAFIAAPLGSMPFRLWCCLLAQPEIVSAVTFAHNVTFNFGDEIWIHGGIGFTALLILFHNDSSNVASVPANRGLLHCESEGSWYKPGHKFGNATIGTAQSSHIDQYRHTTYVQQNADLSKILTKLTAAQLARVKIAQHLQKLFWLQ